MIHRTLLLGASLLLSVPLCAATTADVDTLMDVSGITKQFADLPKTFIAGMKQGMQQDEDSDPAVSAMLMEAAERTVTVERFLNPVRQQLDEGLSKADIKTLIEWHQSPVGERITQAEVQASTPQANEHMLALAPQLLQDVALVERADRIDAAVGITDLTMDVQENVTLIIMQTVAATTEGAEPVDEEAFRLQWEVVEPQVRANIQQYTRISAAYTYRQLSEGDVDAYVEFLSSPLGRRFTAAGKQGMAEGFQAVTQAWTRDWAGRLPKPAADAP
ncbi:MAG: DUF2059 domain-containing protein [Abyssibacter sp.]|nr:DUF2059 domain-containing protein [Abyssibacter sp.]MCK5860665.1 DUF2059 domain-containing protein [Abyssibacter sp.]